MKYDRPMIAPKLLAELNKDARDAGYPSHRHNSDKSRWTYLKKLLALGRQYKDVLKAN
jgi:hypothetical protein